MKGIGIRIFVKWWKLGITTVERDKNKKKYVHE